MKTLALFLCSAMAGLTVGCGSASDELPVGKEHITYYDRNGDGKVDLEKHEYRDVADADWELRDDDFNGRYEKRVQFGVGIFESAVDVPVPTGVKIEK